MTMTAFTTVAVFTYQHEIELLKHQLNMEGIAYFFENETTLSVAPHYSVALGGIKLKVHPNDVEAVKEIINRLNHDGNLSIV
jgi:hypothetical protein